MKITYFLLRLLILLMIVDPTGDQGLTDTNELYAFIGEIIRYCIMGITPIVLILSFRATLLKIKLKPRLLYGLLSVYLIFGYGLAIGLLGNIPRNVFNEALGMIPLFFIPAILTLKSNEQLGLAKFILYSLISVCLVKFILTQVEVLSIYGTLSWRVLVKQSPLLIFPFCFFLIKILRDEYRIRNLLLIVVCFFLLLSAQARGLNIAILFATFILLIKMRANSAKFVVFILSFIVAGLMQSVMTGVNIENTIGFWSGDNYDYTVQHRFDQSEMLVERAFENLFFGVGFGYFTPGYLDFEDLDKPFQLELDLFNFATKIGVVAFVIYILTYKAFVKWIYNKHYRASEYDEICISYSVLIFSLLLYSVFQTFHSSVLYWMIYSVSFSFIGYRESQVLRCCSPISNNQPTNR